MTDNMETIMESWGSYPKIYNLGHYAITDLLEHPMLVEEKVDGSQFSFGRFGSEMRFRSKGAQINTFAPERMFERGVEAVMAMADELRDGWTYRGEYLQKPKHNSLAYERTPEQHTILFDVNTGDQQYLGRDDKEDEAKRLGLEVVPLVFSGVVDGVDHIHAMMDRVSVLGGQKVEGLVFKQYERFGRDGKALMGKHVSEAFKEVHSKEWKTQNPAGKDVLSLIGEQYRCKARWNKAIQHMRDRGELTGTPRDIGKLIKEVPDDILAECRPEIMEALWKWAWPHIRRHVTRGLPEHYKECLMKAQFDEP